MRVKERKREIKNWKRFWKLVALKIGAVWRCPVRTDLTKKFQLPRLNFEQNIEIVSLLSWLRKLWTGCYRWTDSLLHKCFHNIKLYGRIARIIRISVVKTKFAFISTRDCDLYKFVSCGKFVNDILFITIYKTHYLTLEHHALAVTLCLCLNFFSNYQQLNCFDKAKEA